MNSGVVRMYFCLTRSLKKINVSEQKMLEECVYLFPR